MAGSKRHSHAASRATPRRFSALHQLAAALPSFDHALDDFIARANQTEVVVGEDDVVSEAAANEAGAVPGAADRAGAEGAGASLDDRLAQLHHRLAEAEARDQALRKELAGLQGRLVDAEARGAGLRALRARRWLAMAGSFAAGVAVMFAVVLVVDRLDGDRAEGTAQPATPSAPAIASPAAPPPANPALVVTPIDPPSRPPSGAPPGPPLAQPPAPPSVQVPPAPAEPPLQASRPGRSTAAPPRPGQRARAARAIEAAGSSSIPGDSEPVRNALVPPTVPDHAAGELVDPFAEPGTSGGSSASPARSPPTPTPSTTSGSPANPF